MPDWQPARRKVRGTLTPRNSIVQSIQVSYYQHLKAGILSDEVSVSMDGEDKKPN
jgi:hypothetical protein